MERISPIDEIGYEAIKRIHLERPGIGDAPMFPSRDDPQRAINRRVARYWLLEAERLAGVEKQKGSLWHAYRRGWATARQDLASGKVAEAGGWGDVATMERCYQHAQLSDQLEVVQNRRKAQG